MRHLLFVGFVFFLAIGLHADTQLIPLVDSADPLLITNAKIEFEDDVRPIAYVELENQTDSVINTDVVQLRMARFYTRTEAMAGKNAAGIKAWDCGMGGHVDAPRSQSILPHRRAVVTVSIEGCDHNRAHEHFFVTLDRLARHFSDASWTRDSKQFAELLYNAMPHP